jgi:hypothetical protein
VERLRRVPALALALAVFGCCPRLQQRTAACPAALIAAVAEHARHVPDAPHRATAIRATAGAWARFRARRLDPHELAWAVTENLTNLLARSTGPTGRPRSPALRRADPVELVLAP